jgi:hypothetical protein
LLLDLEDLTVANVARHRRIMPDPTSAVAWRNSPPG